QALACCAPTVETTIIDPDTPITKTLEQEPSGLITEMKFLYLFALLIVLFAMVHSLKVRKPKRETVYVQLPPEVPGGEPRYVKAPKVMTEYDKCKMECKRQRDAQYRKEHIAALREELAILEAQEAAEVTAGAPGTQRE
ncbi:hypothetical protein OSTOST_08451, partial [Ostertagia ostertagi]